MMESVRSKTMSETLGLKDGAVNIFRTKSVPIHSLEVYHCKSDLLCKLIVVPFMEALFGTF